MRGLIILIQSPIIITSLSKSSLTVVFVQDTLRECRPHDRHCLSYLPLISPVYFVTFVLTAQFVLVNVVVAVLMKHLEESNKEAQLEEMEERREREEAAARLLGSSVLGGDTVGNADPPVQVTNAGRLGVCVAVEGSGGDRYGLSRVAGASGG